MKKIIGIIGFGNMGSAIAGQIKTDYKVIAFDKDSSKLDNLQGIEKAGSFPDLIEKSDVIILAVKPQDFEGLLNTIKTCSHLADKLFISIAAGITTSYIERFFGVARVIRVMPNLPASIGEGMTCLSKGSFATDQDLEFADGLLEYLGEVMEIKEPMMNAATAVSGSGPAYVCRFIEARALDIHGINKKEYIDFIIDFADAATALGFTKKEASELVENTFNGTIKFLKATGLSAADLIKKVASKAGTTEAALEVLNNGGSLKEAVRAAAKRAEELSKE